VAAICFFRKENRMSSATAAIRQSAVVVEIGGVPIRLRCDNAVFLEQIEERYAGYVSSSSGGVRF
jgi:hypothetical protein